MTPTTHPRFRKLKARMVYMDVNQKELAKEINHSCSYVSSRMSGDKDWELSDCYMILALLKEPVEKLPEYFPPTR